MFDILSIIPGKKKHTSSGWTSFNAPCCHHRGHKQDKRMRGGVKSNGENWSYHCFNCNFKCGFTLGRQLTSNTKMLLNWLGIDESQVNKWNLESLQHKDLLDLTRVIKQKKKVKFDEVPLPEADFIDVNNPDHKVFIDYLAARGLNYADYPYMVTPYEEGRNSNRVIIPFTFNNKIVGNTSRYLDNRTPKFISEQQSGYLFGYDFQKPEWHCCIVVEGIFDALSINGCALTTNTIGDTQVDLLRNLNKTIIVVPDQDKTGLAICDQALELGFQVSLPDWGPDVKDVNDAVVKYGRLPTLLSILHSATNSKIKIQMARTKLDKRI
jgi:hypothetical protein